MVKSLALFAVFVMVFAASGLWAQPAYKEGKWEITSQTEMKGMEGMKMPPQKVTQCITKKDMVPQDPQKSGECKMLEQKVSGDTVTWAMRCTSKEGTAESRGRITYKTDRYDGVVTTVTSSPGEQKMEMSTKLTGKYIGPCK